jgi:menaquinone-9 beta-reductase
MTYDAIIIGGGPAGATAAILLARAGWSVAIVEKASFPRRKVCGEFISASNAQVLNELAVGETIRRRAGPDVRRVGLFADDTVLTSAMPRAAGAMLGWGRALGRESLDLLLLERAAEDGATVWQPWSAVDPSPCGDGYACRISARNAEKTLHAPTIIAAHGSWERGALSTQPNRARRPSDLLAFKAHFINSDLAPDLMPLLAFPGGYGGMVQSDGGRVSLSCCIRRDALRDCRRRHTALHAGEAVYRHILESCLGVRENLGRAILDGRWLSAGPIDPGIRPRYAHGIFRVGNAAGEAHPIVAEGISMAMQSAWLLCRQLIAHHDNIASQRARADAGHEYSAEWRSHFATRIHAAALFAGLAMRPSSATLLLPLIRRFPKMLTWGAKLSGKTKSIDAAGHLGAWLQSPLA